MANRKFITVTYIANTLYWDCPNKCGRFYTMVDSDGLPKTFHCACGMTHIVEQVSEIFQRTARILIEVKNYETNSA